MQNLRAILIALSFLGLTLLLMPLQLLILCSSRKLSQLLPWHYHRILVGLLGMTVEVEGQIPQAPALLVCNHVSWLDIPALGSVMPLSFIAKSEVANWPLFGWMAKLQRSVFINRQSRHATRNSAKTIKTRFQIDDCVVLFPEGTSGDGRTVRTFKSSFFGVVEGLDIPVIPVTLVYCRHYNLPLTGRRRPNFAWYGDMDLVPHLWAALQAGPIKVKVRFQDALAKVGRKEMAKLAEEAIRRGLIEALHGRPEIR